MFIDLHVVNTITTPKIDMYLNSLGFTKHTVDSPYIVSKFVYTKEFAKNENQKSSELFEVIIKDLEQNPDFKGYVELEKVVDEREIPDSDYNSFDLENWSNLSLARYTPEKVKGKNYKKMDMHFRANKIDPKLQSLLLDLGCYYADFTDKAKQNNSLHRVFTLQFFDPKIGRLFYNQVMDLILKCGGFTGKIQFEPTLKYWQKNDYQLPPCVY